MSNNLRVLELIFITGDESEVDSSQFPTLTVFQDGDSYHIASGFEHIREALAKSFRHLGSRHHQALFMRVEVRQGTNLDASLYSRSRKRRR